MHLTRYAENTRDTQFFEGGGPQGDFFEKTKKKQFLDEVDGSMCTNFQVCIVFRLDRRPDTNKKKINTHISLH